MNRQNELEAGAIRHTRRLEKKRHGYLEKWRARNVKFATRDHANIALEQVFRIK